jgi:hypothetical protein
MSDMEREREILYTFLSWIREGAMGQMLYTELNGSLLIKKKRSWDEKEIEGQTKQGENICSSTQ